MLPRSPARSVADVRGTGTRTISKRLIFSYVVDWIVIIGTAAVGGGLSKIVGNMHDFNIYDPDISYPKKSDTVSVMTLLLVTILTPAAIIVLICLFLIPGSTGSDSAYRKPSLIWRRRLWEWNTGWMGLAMSLAGTYLVTEGLKDLFGKPRPDLLARCDPDLAHLADHLVGGLGLRFENGPVMVSHTICQNRDLSVLNDGFASFPSGHASSSWAGLLYLSLFLASKFSVGIPYLVQGRDANSKGDQTRASTFQQYDREGNSGEMSLEHGQVHATGAAKGASIIPPRNLSAAPPLPALVVVFIPIATALAISATRWSDNRHHGWDILGGALIGIFFACFSFRWYHLPIRRGAGWSWGARSQDRAFWIGVGVGGWVGPEGWGSIRQQRHVQAHEDEFQGKRDLESGGGVPVDRTASTERMKSVEELPHPGHQGINGVEEAQQGRHLRPNSKGNDRSSQQRAIEMDSIRGSNVTTLQAQE